MILQRTFIKAAIARADHHAKSVRQSIPVVTGNLQIYADIKKHLTNVVWFEVNNKPYVVRYNHKFKTIEFLNKNIRGELLFSCNNTTDIKSINDFFLTL
jgi:hypothetical protein